MVRGSLVRPCDSSARWEHYWKQPGPPMLRHHLRKLLWEIHFESLAERVWSCEKLQVERMNSKKQFPRDCGMRNEVRLHSVLLSQTNIADTLFQLHAEPRNVILLAFGLQYFRWWLAIVSVANRFAPSALSRRRFSRTFPETTPAPAMTSENLTLFFQWWFVESNRRRLTLTDHREGHLHQIG